MPAGDVTNALMEPVAPPVIASASAKFFDRYSLVVLMIAASIVLRRTFLIARAHSDYWDDQQHFTWGLVFLRGEKMHLSFNDPPLGDGILTLPMLLMGCKPDPTEPQSYPHGAVHGDRINVLYD